MSLIRPLLRGLQGQTTARLQGIVVASGTGLAVNVNGNTIPARAIDPLVVAVGDPVAVDFVAGPQGQAEAWIVGRLAATARPATGKVKTVPPSSPSITVTGTDGTDYTATFLSTYTPAVGDNVALVWNAATPTALGKVGTITPGAPPAAPAPTAPVPAPPQLPASGTTNYPATDASTWGTGGWGQMGGTDIYQGDSGTGPMTGAWFYAGSPAELAGYTVTAVRFTLGARNGAGASGSPVTVNLYTHTSTTRPTGNVTLGSASTQATAVPGQGGTVYSLPTSFAADLLNGGGIAITGGSYAGFNGRNRQPDSGLLSIDWSR